MRWHAGSKKRLRQAKEEPVTKPLRDFDLD
jgi:hypothetical protein